MKKKKPDYSIFSRMAFWGSEYLPKNLGYSINDIREWACKNKMIWEFEAQFITDERLYELYNYFKPEDELFVLINVYQDEKGKLNYMEYPYIQVKTLIKQQVQIEVVYWQLGPKITNTGIRREFDELRFGFWYPGFTGHEIASASFGKVVFKKFFDLFDSLQNEYDTKVLPNGFTEIVVDGAIEAKFFKTGRLHDVDLLQ